LALAAMLLGPRADRSSNKGKAGAKGKRKWAKEQ